MDLPDEVVRTIANGYLEGEDLESFMNEVCEASRILRAVIKANEERSRLKKELTLKLQQLNESIGCPHEYIKYCGDASGGSDSHYECLICGEIVD